MLIYPAIDLKGGRCVRLTQGKAETEIVYSEDPLHIARLWSSKGAGRIHLVDLDGAVQGKPVHLDLALGIARAVDIPVQLGGGIRTSEDVRACFAAGIDRVVLATRAIEDEVWLDALLRDYAGRIVISVDARDGKVALRGWGQVSALDALEVARRLERKDLAAIIFTDISRDGMLQGPNLSSVERMAESVKLPLIVAGGISRLDDIRKLKRLGVSGVIIGKALYTGAIDLEEAIQVAQEG